jgi:hypothetical protein
MICPHVRLASSENAERAVISDLQQQPIPARLGGADQQGNVDVRNHFGLRTIPTLIEVVLLTLGAGETP